MLARKREPFLGLVELFAKPFAGLSMPRTLATETFLGPAVDLVKEVTDERAEDVTDAFALA